MTFTTRVVPPLPSSLSLPKSRSQSVVPLFGDGAPVLALGFVHHRAHQHRNVRLELGDTPETSLATRLPGCGEDAVGDPEEGSPERDGARHEELPMSRDAVRSKRYIHHCQSFDQKR